MTRRKQSFDIRVKAAEIAQNRKYTFRESNTIAGQLEDQPAKQLANGDETLKLKPMSFTKGLPHDYASGLIKSDDHFAKFVKGIDSGNPKDFIATPLGPEATLADPVREPIPKDWRSKRGEATNDVRAWESESAGLAFDLQGPDAQAVMMPPAPKLGSDELTAEIAEVYAQAALRDLSFNVFYHPAKSKQKERKAAQQVIDALNKLPYFAEGKRNGAKLTLDNAFRGFTKGDMVGPYLSQFLLMGNNGLNTGGDVTPEFDVADGFINYGAITIDQRVRRAKTINYMTSWDEWFDVQNGANFGGQELYRGDDRRFMTTGRDLSTYVHYDALYEAYLNACLMLLEAKIGAGLDKFDHGIPFQGPDWKDHQQGFALFGGPHILSLVTEVATRALKAVRYQKFNVHRRLRPEALGGRFARLDKVTSDLHKLGESEAAENFGKMFKELKHVGILKGDGDDLLLPMAFVEGSPMHPTYGAGHATVAGACVTILKAFFNTDLYLRIAEDGDTFSLSGDERESNCAFVPNNSGKRLQTVSTKPLTLEGELNKLAANIAIGRDWAGVHYYSDYVQSLLMGEEIAIGILQEQSITYTPAEQVSMTVNKFDGSSVTIKDGELH